MRAIDANELVKKLSKEAVHKLKQAFNDDSTAEARGIVMAIDSVKKTPTIDPVKHGGIDHIKSLYFSDGCHVINEWAKCSECGHSVDDFGQNYCSNCGAKLDGEHRFFRKKTMFVEGEDAIVPISKLEYQKASRWEYEID